ncbi:MAG: hypothetical protein ACI9PP_000839 [Halobacteriales archaeon]|jgi:hypothetical protein
MEIRKMVIVASIGAVVLLAGCGAIPLGSDSGPSMPPGLSDDGVRNASELTSAHRETLTNRPHTVDVNETIRYENGSLWGSKRATIRVDPASRIATAVVEPKPTNGPFSPPFHLSARTVEFYRNGTAIAAKASNDTTTKQVPPSVPGTGSNLRDPKMVPPLLTGLELQYKGTVERKGRTLYRIEATEVTDEDLVASTVLSGRRYDDIRNVSFRALVTERGLVAQYRVTYAVVKTEGYKFPDTEDGVVIGGKRTVTFRAIGTTTVERPEWVGNRSAA